MDSGCGHGKQNQKSLSTGGAKKTGEVGGIKEGKKVNVIEAISTGKTAKKISLDWKEGKSRGMLPRFVK